jgi:y4mF family transcriptional regulator
MHSDDDMPNLGRELRGLRETQGLRQDELALAAGVSTRTVHAIEAGKATARIDGVLRLAEALGHRLALQPRRPGGDHEGDA